MEQTLGYLSSILDSAYEWRLHKKLVVWHRVLGVYVFVLLAWSLYRGFLFDFPVWFEEVVLKALVFGGPVLWVALRRDGLNLKNLGMNVDSLFTSVYMGLGLGVMMGFLGQIGNFLRHGGLELSSYGLSGSTLVAFLLLSLVTGFWEQLLFSGYILQRLKTVVSSEWWLVGVVTFLFVLLHVPALIFVQQLNMAQLFLGVALLSLLQVGASILMLRTENLAAPLLAQALWGTTVFLFR